ncbi:unnamed protein product [Brachionus calyciflorus]|uniref:Uncharacterized protein n=1 Tax=Brachionus calyciflorus TaxID=104777 RepID=A0A813P6L4_9BILA|nr:unnamed protein product [Brachionus calyciflorus]
MTESKRLKLKYCLIGSEAVGKTSFSRNLDSKPFEDGYNPTIGVELLIYLSSFDGQDIKYQIWDTSGKEINNTLVKEYCKNSNGILAFYDITKKETFENLKETIQSLKSVINEKTSVIIIGNKKDLEEQRQVTREEVEEFCRENKYLFNEISVKESLSSVGDTINKITSHSMRNVDLFNIESFTARSFTLSLPRLVNENTSALSTARTHRIDAMSNSVLISNTNIYNRLSEVETRKFIADLIDQIKMLKSDVDKKDRLILKLSNTRDPKSSRFEEASEFDRFLSIERNAFNTVKKEIELKYETAFNQLNEEKAKVIVKEETIKNLKIDSETLREEITTLNKIIEEKCTKISQLEGDLCNYENVSAKSNITINALQIDNKELQAKVLELESNIRKVQCEKEEIEFFLKTSNEKIKSITDSIETSSVENFDTILIRLKELKTESLISKGKFSEITEKYTFVQTENNLKKQTILELKEEIRSLEKQILEYKISIEQHKTEKDAAVSSKEIIEKELEILKQKALNTHDVWLSTTKNLDTKEQQIIEFETNVKNLESNLSHQTAEFQLFLDEVAKLLSDDYFKVEATKHEIKEKIKLLMLSSKHRGVMIATLEEKLQIQSEQLEIELDEKSSLKQIRQSTQNFVRDLEDKIVNLENLLSEQKLLNETLSSERAKVLKCIESLSNSYELPTDIITIPTLDKCLEIVLYKIETKKRPVEIINIDKTSFEAKINSLHEQLTNKDIHLDLLRKKLTDLEEEKLGRSEIRTEYDNLVKINKRLNIKVERLSEELASFKSENANLKSYLVDINDLKFDITNKESEMAKMRLKIAELESACDGYVLKIGSIRDDYDLTKSQLDKTVVSSDSTIKALSSELRSLKIDYEKTKSREHQLLDFRNVVAKKVGLECNSLRVPDFEIIARIEFFVRDRIHLIDHQPTIITNIPSF